MDKTQSYIVYRPPKSNSFGHAIRDRNISRATKMVIDGFKECFDNTSEDTLKLTLYYNKKEELEKAHKTIDKLNEFMGLPIREWENIGFDLMENNITWQNKEKSILDVIAYVEELKEECFLPLSKYWISSHLSFKINLEFNGSIMLSIESGRLFVRLKLVFPKSIDDDETYNLIYKLHSMLPFKFNSKHFRRLISNNKGYRQLKLDEQTLNRLEECLIKSKKNKVY